MICDPPRPARAVTRFTAQLALVDLLETRSLFTAGYDCMLHIHTCETEVVVGRLLTIIDNKVSKGASKGAREQGRESEGTRQRVCERARR